MVVIFFTAVQAFEDPLEQPAIMSDLVTQSLLLDVELTGGRIVAVGERGHIIFSDDNGQRWQQAQVPVSETLTAVNFPAGGKRGWAVGHAGVILVSADAGKTWTEQLDGNHVNQLMVDAATATLTAKKAELESAPEEDRSRLQAELEELEYQLSREKDFAAGGPTRPFLDVNFRNENEGFAVGQFGLILQTRDGGKTWATPAVAVNNPDGYHYNAVLWTGEAWFLAGEKGFAAQSPDDGRLWEVIETPYKGTFFAVGADEHSIILLGLRGNAVISFDRGDSWESVDTGVKNSLSAVRFLNDGRLLISQYGENLLVSDASRTRLTPLTWLAGTSISSFVFARDGSLITVGVGGVKRIPKDDVSTEVNE